MRRLTMSVLADAMACSYQFREGIPLEPDKRRPSGVLGTAFHSLVEEDRTSPDVTSAVTAYGLAPSYAKKLAAMWQRWLAWWPRWRGTLAWERELPLAMDPDVGVARVPEITEQGRTKDPREGEITGRVDLLAIDGDTLHVGDIKTGVLPVPRADVNLQIGYGAASVLRLPMYKGTIKRVRLFVARISDYQEPWADEATKPAEEVEGVIDQVSFMRSGIPSSEPVPHRDENGGPSGPCRFCRARAACPAWAVDLEPALRASVRA